MKIRPDFGVTQHIAFLQETKAKRKIALKIALTVPDSLTTPQQN
jgi:hypothetical protein